MAWIELSFLQMMPTVDTVINLVKLSIPDTCKEAKG
jgi:hypothetical protein